MKEIIIKKVEEKAKSVWTNALNVVNQAAIDEAKKLGLSESGSKIFINALASGSNVCPDAVKESVINDLLKSIELVTCGEIVEKLTTDVDDENDEIIHGEGEGEGEGDKCQEIDRETFLRDEIFKFTGKKPGGNSKLETLEKTYADLLETANGGDDG